MIPSWTVNQLCDNPTTNNFSFWSEEDEKVKLQTSWQQVCTLVFQSATSLNLKVKGGGSWQNAKYCILMVLFLLICKPSPLCMWRMVALLMAGCKVPLLLTRNPSPLCLWRIIACLLARGGQNDDLLSSTYTSTFDPTGRRPTCSLPF